MHTASVFVAALVAAASLASAEPENRPKIYFPRHVKRQYTNHTITSSASQSTKSDLADSTTHSSTKKDTISDLLSSLLGGFDPSDSTTSTSSGRTPSPTRSSSLGESESESKRPSKTDSSSSTGSSAGVPPLIVLPTLSLDLPTLPIESDTATVSANTTSVSTESSSAETSTVEATTTAESTTEATSESATDPTTTIPSSASSILLAPTGVVTPTSSSSSGGLLDGVTSVVGGLTSALLPSSSANATESSGTESGTSAPTESSTDDVGLSLTLFPSTTSFPGTAPTASTSSSETPLITLPPLLSSSSSVSVSTPVTNATESSLTPTETGSVSIPLSSSTAVPSNTTATTDSATLPTSVTSPTVSLNTTVSATEPPTSESSSIVTVSQNTTIPTTSAEPTTTSESSTFEPTTVLPISTAASTTSSASLPAVTSVPAIGTITNSESWLPTTIIVEASTSSINTGGSATATGIPTTLPKQINPFTEPTKQPDDTTLIQISFLFGENYQHLADHPLAASQIFLLLPKGLAFGGGFDVDRVVMESIRPYDTTSQLGYITSQAMVYYPTEGVDQLSADIGYPTTPLYNHGDPLVRNLTSEINPAIGIYPGNSLGGVPGATGGSGDSPTDTDAPNNDPFDTQGPGEQTTSAQQGMTAGIAVGAASVAGAYGAAMFIIARRYKRKKQRHQRSSSVTSPSDMRQTGSPALMGGALLSRDFTSSPGYGGAGGNTRDSQGSGRSGMNNSARTAGISAPVAAENSLGWN
ncbi:hypothetical protein F4677DRAFT_44271 [Hypoxylon crocopeplum]|nr:hypothetical protein F4677DRAFT_44271 [Hypoxylon crocopeplum]